MSAAWHIADAEYGGAFQMVIVHLQSGDWRVEKVFQDENWFQSRRNPWGHERSPTQYSKHRNNWWEGRATVANTAKHRETRISPKQGVRIKSVSNGAT